MHLQELWWSRPGVVICSNHTLTLSDRRTLPRGAALSHLSAGKSHGTTSVSLARAYCAVAILAHLKRLHLSASTRAGLYTPTLEPDTYCSERASLHLSMAAHVGQTQFERWFVFICTALVSSSSRATADSVSAPEFHCIAEQSIVDSCRAATFDTSAADQNIRRYDDPHCCSIVAAESLGLHASSLDLVNSTYHVERHSHCSGRRSGFGVILRARVARSHDRSAKPYPHLHTQLTIHL